MDLRTTAELFRALGDPGRLRILALLGNPPPDSCAPGGKVCACDLTEHTGLSQPTVSHHMKLLVQAGLVTATKRGRWTDYALDPAGFERAAQVLRGLQVDAERVSTRTMGSGAPDIAAPAAEGC